jgi:hypothetical protein
MLQRLPQETGYGLVSTSGVLVATEEKRAVWGLVHTISNRSARLLKARGHRSAWNTTSEQVIRILWLCSLAITHMLEGYLQVSSGRMSLRVTITSISESLASKNLVWHMLWRMYMHSPLVAATKI